MREHACALHGASHGMHRGACHDCMVRSPGGWVVPSFPPQAIVILALAKRFGGATIAGAGTHGWVGGISLSVTKIEDLTRPGPPAISGVAATADALVSWIDLPAGRRSGDAADLFLGRCVGA